MDVRGQLRRAAGFFADEEAIVVGDTRLTFAQAWERGLRTANLLGSIGLRPGDRVGVLEDNSVHAADLFLGAAAANVVRVPLYPRNPRATHAHMLRHTGCRVLIVDEAHAAEVTDIAALAPDLERVLVRGAGYEAMLAAQPADDPDPPVAPDDLFIIRHTGGTTGVPRGVAYTHWKWLAAGRDWFYAWPPVRIGDACLHVGPIAHGSGYLFAPVWIAGGRNVLASTFDPRSFADTIERERIAYAFVVPTMLNALVNEPAVRGRDYSSLKVINVAAAPISDATALRAQELLGGVVYQAYGQTEALPATMAAPDDWMQTVEGSTPLRSAGRPLPFIEVGIRDPETHEPLPIGAEGEIAIQCDAQMTGYWNDPEADAGRLHDGWVLTGDIGRLDARGFLYVLDRKDDVIVSGGYNIWPAEIENVLLDHPAIIEAAVFAVPDARWGETPLAMCHVRDGADVQVDELIGMVATRLGSYKKPSRVILVDRPLPKSPLGKVQRRVLGASYWQGRERRVSGA